MDLGDVFRRNLQIAVAHSGEPEAAICRRAGVGKDILRHFFSGKAQSMSVIRAAAIAKALDIDLDRLTAPDFSAAELTNRKGLSEDAAEPWQPPATGVQKPDKKNRFAHTLAPNAKTPETYRIVADHAPFGILAGDIVVIDLGRIAAGGDLVLATIPSAATAGHETVLRRFAPPYLIASDPLDPRPAILDDGSLPPLRPIVAVLRSEDF